MRKKNVLLAGVWSSNKGDRAIASYIVEKLHRCSSIDKIYVSTIDKDIIKRYLPNYAIPVGLAWTKSDRITWQVNKRIRYKMMARMLRKGKIGNLCFFSSGDNLHAYNDVDYIIFTGGHHITTLLIKDGIFHVTYEMGLMAISGKRYSLWTQTIGPLDLDRQIEKYYFNDILSHADRVYIRDENSRNVVKDKYPDLTNIYESNDSVFGMYLLLEQKIMRVKKENKVGVSIYLENIKTEEEEKNYIARIRKICEYVLAKGYKIEFFPMETQKRELEAIKQISSNFTNVEVYDTNCATENHMLEIASCKYYIGHKTHSIIMALTMCVPLVALCYHKKAYDFMKSFGVEEYALLDENYSFEAFATCFEDLIRNGELVGSKLHESSQKISSSVNRDFDEFLNTIVIGEKND